MDSTQDVTRPLISGVINLERISDAGICRVYQHDTRIRAYAHITDTAM